MKKIISFPRKRSRFDDPETWNDGPMLKTMPLWLKCIFISVAATIIGTWLWAVVLLTLVIWKYVWS